MQNECSRNMGNRDERKNQSKGQRATERGKERCWKRQSVRSQWNIIAIQKPFMMLFTTTTPFFITEHRFMCVGVKHALHFGCDFDTSIHKTKPIKNQIKLKHTLCTTKWVIKRIKFSPPDYCKHHIWMTNNSNNWRFCRTDFHLSVSIVF